MSISRLLLALAVATPLALPQPDEAEVRAALEHYFRGQATGDVAHYRAAFQPSANLYWIRDGKFAERASAEWIAANAGNAAAASGAPRPAAGERRQRIAHVDISGTAAIAKLVTETPERVVTDYMTLLKTESGWRIVSKTFAVEPRTR